MFALLRHPRVRLRKPSAAFGCAVALAGSTLVLAGCGSGHSNSFAGRSDIGNPAIALQRAHMAQMQKPHVEDLEADGLPVQTAPFRTRQRRADDPSEPFSPNYGSQPVPEAQHEREAHAPHLLGRRHVSVAGWRALDPVEAEILVSRALAAHEQRNP